jgi:hypothetical protein
LTGTFLRFYWLALKPLHHDEGVNGWFLTNLYRDGVYKYDPANYHGPTLYYISLAFAKVFGLETVSIRASVAIWGVLVVLLACFLRRYIGRVGSLFAALFLALSPGMVYISRYFIHEMFFVFLGLALVVAIVFFIEKQKAGIFAIGWMALLLLVSFLPSTLKLASVVGRSETAVWAFSGGFLIVEVILIGLVIKMLLTWNNGRPIYFLLAVACASLMFATKETAFITLGTMAIACACVWLWRKIFRVTDVADETVEEDIRDSYLTWANFRAALGSGTDLLLIAVASALVFIYLIVLFFTSFFTYPDGVKGAIEAYTIWTKTGSKDHTQNGIWAYVKWGMESEAPIFLLSAARYSHLIRKGKTPVRDVRLLVGIRVIRGVHDHPLQDAVAGDQFHSADVYRRGLRDQRNGGGEEYLAETYRYPASDRGDDHARVSDVRVELRPLRRRGRGVHLRAYESGVSRPDAEDQLLRGQERKGIGREDRYRIARLLADGVVPARLQAGELPWPVCRHKRLPR